MQIVKEPSCTMHRVYYRQKKKGSDDEDVTPRKVTVHPVAKQKKRQTTALTLNTLPNPEVYNLFACCNVTFFVVMNDQVVGSPSILISFIMLSCWHYLLSYLKWEINCLFALLFSASLCCMHAHAHTPPHTHTHPYTHALCGLTLSSQLNSWPMYL